MPKGYFQIPDWFSFDNQGGGVAVADVTGVGNQDLLVITVDNPGGQNRGVYRVGHSLDAQGKVTAGWTRWIEVPDWFSFENQGAGAAVIDLDKDGHQDLIVFMIDNPPGQNQGYYRVGKRLDADGNVTGGWGPWIAIPDWFSFENQHGSIAVADLDQDGNPELIVMMVDNPAAQNRGLYRIGRRLDADGNVTGGWTGWIDVPDWFSWENQGASVAVIDLENTVIPICSSFRSITRSNRTRLSTRLAGSSTSTATSRNGAYGAGCRPGSLGKTRVAASRPCDATGSRRWSP
jgi:hypothetical protein